MNSTEYKSAREKLGTQQAVASLLGVDYRTIQRREAGTVAITHEAELAILSLRVRKKKRAPRQPNTEVSHQPK